MKNSTNPVCTLMLILVIVVVSYGEKPHIVVILLDDLGWGDISISNPLLPKAKFAETPSLEKLSSEGITLDNLYSNSMCTPTRASLLTGKYPYRINRAISYSVLAERLWPEDGLGLEHHLISESLQHRGYSGHAIGKWHLGFDPPLTPVDRGFNSFYGLYTGMFDYYTHKLLNEPFTNDIHHDVRNTSGVFYGDISNETRGIHATDLFTQRAIDVIEENDNTAPLFLYLAYNAPHSLLQPHPAVLANRNNHIADTEARKYAAMITQVDDGISRVVDALNRTHMLDNTYIIFLSDNGATWTPEDCWDFVGGRNKPYRGGKTTNFEGGIKSVSFIWSPLLPAELQGVRSSALLHVVDVHSLLEYLTLGFKEKVNKDVDGSNHLIQLIEGKSTNGRETILHALITDVPVTRQLYYCTSKNISLPFNYSVLRHGSFKLFMGAGLRYMCTSDTLRDGCPPLQSHPDIPDSSVLLFNIADDPYETTNIASQHAREVREMTAIIEGYKKNTVDYWYSP